MASVSSWVLRARCVHRFHPHALAPPHVAFRELCCDSAQAASAFNQPLSLDTSSVTNMYGMFQVSPLRVPSPQSPVRPSVHAACTATAPPRPRASRPACHPFVSPVATRQEATAFNQPLSFDTSSVTSMDRLFLVRPPRVYHGPSVQSDPPGTLRAPPPPPPTPARLSPRVSLLCEPRCDSAGSNGIQPAAEL